MAEYNYKIDCSPSNSILKIELENQEITVETGAMIYRSPDIKIDTNMKGGLMGALKRTVVGEGAFMNNFSGTGILALAPSFTGDIIHHELDGTMYVQSGAYMASSPQIDIDTKFGGGKSFFGGKGLFLMKMEGKGDVFLSSFGAFETIELNNEKIIVDNGNLVGFTDGLNYELKILGGLKSTLLSGEGIRGRIYEFSGTGKIFIQTRDIGAFSNILMKYLPIKR